MSIYRLGACSRHLSAAAFRTTSVCSRFAAMDHLPTVTIEKCLNVDSPEHDAVVLVAQDPFALTEELRALQPCLQAYSEVRSFFHDG